MTKLSYIEIQKETWLPVRRGGDENPGDDPDTPKPIKKKSSTRKYICPKCGLSIRATKVVRIACMDCGNIQMEEVADQNKNP